MSQGRRYYNDVPSHIKCPSCNFRFQYPGTNLRNHEQGPKEKLRVPYVLSCGHSYCVVCVENQLQSSFHVFCSKCQVSTHVVGKISEVLPIDYNTIGRTVSARSQSLSYGKYSRPDMESNDNSCDPLCQDCSMSPARCLCLDCFVNYCNPCFQRNHFRTSMVMSQHVHLPLCKSGVIGMRTRCETHINQFFDVFCNTCNMSYCYKCEMGQKRHRDHECCSLTDTFMRNLTRLQDLGPRVQRLLDRLKKMDKRRNGVQEQTIVDEIRSRFCQLHGILLQKEEEMIRQCLTPLGSMEGSLGDHAQFLSFLSEDIRSLSQLRSKNADIHLNCEEVSARVALVEQLVKSASAPDKQFSYELDAAKFESLLRQCIKVPDQPGPLEIPSPITTVPSSAVSDVSVKHHELSNIVEVVESDEYHDNEETLVNLPPKSNKATRKKQPINDGTSREFITNLGCQPKSFLGGSLASGDLVFAIHVVNPSRLYLQKENDSDQIRNLFNVCQEIGVKSIPLRSSEVNRLEPGDMLLGEYSADHCWYRCRILCTCALCEGKRCRPGTVTVLFIDYGNCECVRFGQLKKLPPQLENLTNFAYECDLHLLPPSRTWQKDASLVLRDAVDSDKPFVVRVLEQKSDVVMMDLCRPFEQGMGAFSLREHLVLRGFARFPDGDTDLGLSKQKQEDTDISALDDQNLSLASTTLPPTPPSNALIESLSSMDDDADVTIVDGSREPMLELNSEMESLTLLHDEEPSEKSSTVELEINSKLSADESSMNDLNENDTPLCDALAEALDDDPTLTDDPDQISLRLSEISALVNGGAHDGLESVDLDECVLAHKRASQVELPNGSAVHAICVCHDRLNNVWITPEQIKAMAFEEGHPALLSDTEWTLSPQIGGLYAARYSDGFFYRCVVEALVGQGRVSVFFVDFGNQEIVTWKTDMLKLSKRFLSRPYMARLVSLAGITFANKEINCDLVNQVQDLILNENTYQLRYERNIPGCAKDSDAVYLLRKESCVNLQLVELQLADFTSPQQESLMRGLSIIENRRSTTKGRGSKSSAIGSSLPPTFRTRESGTRRPNRWDGSSLIGVMTEDETPLDSCLSSAWEDELTEDELARLANMPSCCVQRVISPGEFYVSMSDANTLEELDNLYKTIDDFYNSRKSAPPKSVSDLKIGSLCVARRSNSMHWFRGRIVGPSSSGSRHVKVEFVDVGDVLNIPLLSIRQPLDRSLATSWPCFAVRCRLLGVRPAGDNPDEWPKTALEKLLELVKRCEKVAFVSRVMDEQNGPSVDLILKENMLDPEKEDETSPQPTCTRLVSLRRSMLNFGVILSKPYDSSLLHNDNDLIIRGLPLEIPSSPQKFPTSSRGDNCEECVLSSSDEDSTLEDHLYQSNNSNQAEDPPALSNVGSCIQSPSPESCAEVVNPNDQLPAVVNVPQLPEGPELVGSCDTSLLTVDVVSRPSESATLDSPLDILRQESIESTGPLEAYRPLFWPPHDHNVDPDSNGIDVQVLNIDDSFTIYCKPIIDNSLELIEEQVNLCGEHFRLPPKKNIGSWDVGEACLALWNKEDKKVWCRGQIQMLNSLTSNATVYLIDHGQFIDVPNDLVRPIKVAFSGEKHPFMEVPPVVWCVKLHDIYPVNPNDTNDLNYLTWSQRDIENIRAEFEMKLVTLFVVEVEPSKYGQQMLMSRVLCPDMDYDQELGERLCLNQIAYRWEHDNPDQRFIKTPDLFRCYPNPDPLPVGVPLEVIITAVETPSEIYLQCPILGHQLPSLCSQFPEHTEWFQSACDSYEFLTFTNYENTSDPLVAGHDLPVACLARYSVDQKLYRAELCYAVETTAKYRVQFVDYGNVDDLSWNDLKSPVHEEKVVCCRRYRWKGLKRHPACTLKKRELRLKILETLEPLVIYAKCEKIYRDGRLPLIDLFEDQECSKPLADILVQKELVCRK